MRPIENLIFENGNWRFTIDGITNFLTNGGHGLQTGEYYTWLNPNGHENEVFGILADGNFLENDNVRIYFILNRRNTTENYLISVEDFQSNMKLIE
jgi:hypothetical protein